MDRGHGRVVRFGAALVLSWLAAGCNQTPTEITPITRAIGEIDAVWLRVSQLAQLDPPTEGVYALYALDDRRQTQLLGTFNVDASGQLVDESGAPKTQFTAEGYQVRDALALLITIELAGNAGADPQGMQILSGTFIDGVAQLTVPISSGIQGAAGSLRVHSPTDGPGTNETSGVWMQDINGDPSLDLVDTTASLHYETFIDIRGRSIPIGRFEVGDMADDANQFISSLVPAPQRPGEDLLTNAPEGLSFPIDLSGARVTISLESRFTTDFVQRSQLIVLEAFLPAGLSGNEQVQFINRTASFPRGEALLY